MKNKRSQASVYIVIALIILIAAGIFFYIKTAGKITGPQAKPKTPVEVFVKECLDSTAIEAIEILGAHSGFIKIPEDLRYDPMGHVSLDKRGAYVVPYWFYDGRERDPSDKEVEKQIADYINENINSCINNFTSLEKLFDITILSEPKATVTLNPNTIDIELDYRIKVMDKTGQSSQEFKRFGSSLDVKLKRILDFARRFMLAENRDGFLEQATLDYMAMNKDIPFTGLEFHCRTMQWNLKDIKQKLQDTLAEMIPMSRIANTNYWPFIADDKTYQDLKSIPLEDIFSGKYPPKSGPLPVPNDAYIYNHMYFNVTNEDFRDLQVHLDYQPQYGMDIYARPSKNGIMKSNVGSGVKKYLSYLCVNIYHFTYDIIYPVIINIRDDSALNNRGYTFTFATPVIIDHNEPKRAVLEARTFWDAVYNADFCNRMGNETYNVRARGNEKGYVDVELANVKISYDCYKYECPLGETQGAGIDTMLTTTIPESCKYGFFVANKDGYLESRVQLTDERDYTINMKKLKNLSVVIEKYDSNNLARRTQPLDNEAFLITFTDLHSDYSETLYITNNTTNPVITLLDEDSEWDITAYSINSDTEEFTGGYVGNWSYLYADSYKADEIVIRLVDYLPHPHDDEGQMRLVDYLETNETYKAALTPVLR